MVPASALALSDKLESYMNGFLVGTISCVLQLNIRAPVRAPHVLVVRKSLSYKEV
jgi:hypothetical protein